ncbi:hypothetical protein [Robertkochia solimangrovi]|uniref:hypothetical protein n=1 Tax=Robertkochia solimangrovi TaxID=2213046 RepID=UPI00117E1279|nr:hypothetical protein [Robertkochia solimangrovi]TRZ46219.1 hypothetical protein DMZ48_02890 [Robertkochia solimangrovi]
MIKRLFKYLLTLAILILSGVVYLYGNEGNAIDGISSKVFPERAVHYNNFSDTSFQDLFIKTTSSGSEREKNLIHENVNEEEFNEMDASQKYIDRYNFLADLSLTLPVTIFHDIKERLSIGKHFSHSTTLRALFIRFRVFRL